MLIFCMCFKVFRELNIYYLDNNTFIQNLTSVKSCLVLLQICQLQGAILINIIIFPSLYFYKILCCHLTSTSEYQEVLVCIQFVSQRNNKVSAHCSKLITTFGSIKEKVKKKQKKKKIFGKWTLDGRQQSSQGLPIKFNKACD